jgi:hypothetical protein
LYNLDPDIRNLVIKTEKKIVKIERLQRAGHLKAEAKELEKCSEEKIKPMIMFSFLINKCRQSDATFMTRTTTQ